MSDIEYSVKKVSALSGVTARTLRYYHEIGLLTPLRVNSSGYRIYGKKELDKLQQILFYREIGMELGEIKKILENKNFDKLKVMENQLDSLRQKKSFIDKMIKTIEKTILYEKGEIKMSDQEKFECFKQNAVNENEMKYGKEIRERYGTEKVERSNKKFREMTKEQHQTIENLSEKINVTLKEAFTLGDPASDTAQEACRLHKEWLTFFWDSYSKEAHMGVAQMYVDDERFAAYYDKIAPGCAVFLRDAVNIYCGK